MKATGPVWFAFFLLSLSRTNTLSLSDSLILFSTSKQKDKTGFLDCSFSYTRFNEKERCKIYIRYG